MRDQPLAKLTETSVTTASSGRLKSPRPKWDGIGGTAATGCGTTRNGIPAGKSGRNAPAVNSLDVQTSWTKPTPTRHSAGATGSSHCQYPTIRRPAVAPRGSRRSAAGSCGEFTCSTNAAPSGGIAAVP